MATSQEPTVEEIYELFRLFNFAFLVDHAGKMGQPRSEENSVPDMSFPTETAFEHLYFFGIPPTLEIFRRDFQCLDNYPDERKELLRILQIGYAKFKVEMEMFLVDTVSVSRGDSVIIGEPTSDQSPPSHLSPFGLMRFYSDYNPDNIVSDLKPHQA